MTDLLTIFLQTVFDVGNARLSLHRPIKNVMEHDDGIIDMQKIKEGLHREHYHLTEEKISQLVLLYRDSWRISPDNSSEANFFYTFVHFVKDKACMCNNQLRVRLDELLRWRKLSFALGEDILACAWLSYRYRWTGQKEWNKYWDISCSVDDPDLQYIYEKGLADLHHHLKASTDVFSLSWICMMNHIMHRYKALGKINGAVPQLYKSCYLAASIRTCLYEYLCGKDVDFTKIEDVDFCDVMMENRLRMLQYRINILRSERSRKCDRTLDYALPDYVDETNDIECIFDGERNILYGVLRAIYRECEQKEALASLLFCYITAKENLRKYMVQTNKNVGFANFSAYERRKDLLLEGYPEYECLLSLLPVIEGERFHHLHYLETRIAPKADIRKMEKSVNQIISDRRQRAVNLVPNLIVHFIKRDCEGWKILHERHHRLRLDVKKQTIVLMTLRRKSRKLFDKFVGVDAANMELDCRPEVFAHAFRYIRQHVDDENRNKKNEHRSLRYTYHAGEDFYDIVDGLRAIDEAVSFLKLGRGDRLGHCIAMGIEPLAYYSCYEFNVIVKKQYLLDNIVWMLYQAKKFSVDIPSDLKMKLEDRYSILVYELYGRNVDIDVYRKAMLIRGDDPCFSVSEGNMWCNDILRNWDSCALDDDSQLDCIRSNDLAKSLYWEYHFNQNVRKSGESLESMQVDREYAECISKIQNAMMAELSTLGIVVECCPSSNLKIGLPNRYDQQPIFRFCPVCSDAKHMSVTINTDDLGIFQTSVDNEFSMLALAALKAKDEKGHSLYGKREVIQWLEEIRENGFKYAFGK